MKLILATLLTLTVMTAHAGPLCDLYQTNLNKAGSGTDDKEMAELREKALAEQEPACKAEKAQEAAHAKLPEPHLGMTAKTVLEKTSHGAPDHINRTVTAGRIVEQWVYDGVYLYFTNGRLTAFQD